MRWQSDSNEYPLHICFNEKYGKWSLNDLVFILPNVCLVIEKAYSAENLSNRCCTVMFLNFWTDRSGQTVQTQIRSTMFAIPPASFECITLKKKTSCLTFRVITANFQVCEILGFLRYYIFRLLLLTSFFFFFSTTRTSFWHGSNFDVKSLVCLSANQMWYKLMAQFLWHQRKLHDCRKSVNFL